MTPTANGPIHKQILGWIQAAKPSATIAEIVRSDLIETRILDSMQFLDFVYFLNELCGADVSSAITVENLRTLSRIVAFVETQQPKLQLAS